jgi:hypothetical protein
MWHFKFSLRRVWSSESCGMFCRVLNWMLTDVSEVCAAYIRAMIEAARTSEKSVDIQLRTRQYIPEDSELHVHELTCRWNTECFNKKFWKEPIQSLTIGRYKYISYRILEWCFTTMNTIRITSRPIPGNKNYQLVLKLLNADTQMVG